MTSDKFFGTNAELLRTPARKVTLKDSHLDI